MTDRQLHIVKTWNINEEWTLFLDRDGTINKLLPNDYVKNWDEFEFIPGVLDAIPVFNEVFRQTIIVTNQQGVGKKIMTEKDLRAIHVEMLEHISVNGGYIDEIYYCPYLASEQKECRKPKTGMGLQAIRDFPSIKFHKSIMIGDSISDMDFGKRLGMKTIFLNAYHRSMSDFPIHLADLIIYDLPTFAQILTLTQKFKI